MNEVRILWSKQLSIFESCWLPHSILCDYQQHIREWLNAKSLSMRRLIYNLSDNRSESKTKIPIKWCNYVEAFCMNRRRPFCAFLIPFIFKWEREKSFVSLVRVLILLSTLDVQSYVGFCDFFRCCSFSCLKSRIMWREVDWNSVFRNTRFQQCRTAARLFVLFFFHIFYFIFYFHFVNVRCEKLWRSEAFIDAVAKFAWTSVRKLENNHIK